MKDTDCVAFLQWALPQLQMRWPGFRKVRRQVCKRIDRRRKALGLPDVGAYRAYLEREAAEWALLDSFCRISISRFYRDRSVFDHLRRVILPALADQVQARGEKELRAWSIGCASGEEIYTLNLIWRLAIQPDYPTLTLRLITTDADEQMLQRAQTGCYPSSSLKDLPPTWQERAFTPTAETFCLRPQFRTGVEFRRQDIRTTHPRETFHLILCRYLVFTYFEASLQQQMLARMTQCLLPGGGLVIGKTESLPNGVSGLEPWFAQENIYRRFE